MVANLDFSHYKEALENVDLVRITGKVVQVVGLIIEAQVPGVFVGELCSIELDENDHLMSEVVGFKGGNVLLMPLGTIAGIKPGTKIHPLGKAHQVKVGDELLGRLLNGLGDPIDGKGPIHYSGEYPVDQDAPDPFKRPRIESILKTGVKAIDSTLTFGKGQRIGIFAGSGVGKSTLLGMLARNCEADINVIALIGERGREVKDFIEENLGEEGLKKSVVICATSDNPPLVRLKGALVATSIAEYFRDQGKNVFFMMDSVTRFAMAQREVGLSTGEPPTSKGYTPSVFALLPRLMERAGTSDKGTITAVYTVLVEGSDMEEPIADTSRGILDGHIILSRDLAAKNHYPCIDVNQSLSRLMSAVTNEDHQKYAGQLREVLATYEEAQDLINIGAYQRGSNPSIDDAIEKIKPVDALLKQRTDENIPFEETVEILSGIFI